MEKHAKMRTPEIHQPPPNDNHALLRLADPNSHCSVPESHQGAGLSALRRAEQRVPSVGQDLGHRHRAVGAERWSRAGSSASSCAEQRVPSAIQELGRRHQAVLSGGC
ncbi:hypothetical protein U1Q18_011897 [Sarracenia purpurea var. burkii]